MSTRTSSQNGNWSSSSTWGGSSPPGDGDKAVINHNVTYDAGASGTVGLAACVDCPTTAPTTAATTGGSLSAYTYNICYVCVDANGVESWNASDTQPTVVGGANNAINVTLPSLPSGVASYNVYYSDGPNILFKMGPSGQGIGAGTTKILTSTGTRRTSPAGVYVNDGKTLTLDADVTIKGSIVLDGGKISQSAGVDVTLNPVTTGVQFRIGMGDYFDMTATQWKTNGSSGSHCTVAAPSGKVACFSFGAQGVSRGAGNLDFAYTDFTRIGDATTPFINLNLDSGGTSPAIANCTFDNCGRIGTYLNIGGTKGFSFTGVNKWTNAQDTTYGLDVRIGCDTASGGPTRTMSGCVFDKGCKISFSGTSFADCFFPDGVVDPGGFGASWTAMDRCLIWMGKGGSGSITGMESGGPITDSYVLADTSNGNSHIIIPRATGTWTGMVFDNTSDDTAAGDNSDILYSPTSCTITLLNAIICFNEIEQNGAGTINANPSFVVKVRHCSGYCNNGMVSLGDLSFGVGTLAEFKSNLCLSPGGTHWKVNYKTQQATPTFDNAMTGANAVYNSGYGLAVGHMGKGYNTDNPDHTPGDNDIDLDGSGGPGCINSLVNAGTWAYDRGYSVTSGTSDANIRQRYADAITALKADFVTRNADLLSYIRDGWAPTNTLLQNAGHDGVTIGAVEGVFGPTGSPINYYAQMM